MDELTRTEYAAVGALLLAPGLVAAVREWLRADDFYRPVCGQIYDLVLAMTDRAEPVDPVSVLGELRRSARLRPDGHPGMELVRMVEAVPVPAAGVYYARLVLEASTLRAIERTGSRLAQLATGGGIDPDTAFTLVREQWRALAEVRGRWRAASGSARVARSGGTDSRLRQRPSAREYPIAAAAARAIER